jgi:hypothetical protein
MTEPYATIYEISIKVWAVLGPLLAAAASAIWLRRNQTIDREYQHSLELERLNRADTAKKLDHQRAVRVAAHDRAREAIAAMMTNSHIYVGKNMNYRMDPSPENDKILDVARERFAECCQLVSLLDDDVLAERAVNFLNGTVEFALAYAKPPDDNYERKFEAYQEERLLFTTEARRHLREQNPERV